MTDARNFLLNTDYPLDKIIYMTSGSVAFSGASATVTIPHGLTFRPLPHIQWSLTSDFEPCYEITERVSEGTPLGFPYYVTYEVDTTNIKISATDYSITATTLYYRIIGFMPSDENESVPSLSELADNFVLNTDYNYTKLYMSGIADANSTINHNLGYIPQVRIWADDGTKIKSTSYYGATDVVGGPNNANEVTSTSIIFSNATTYFHYRIYLDE